jgi:ribosomal protein L16/L10AE
MGKGKGSFDHWASRIAVSKIIFELKGEIHEQVARDAFRLAGNKMPGELLTKLSLFDAQYCIKLAK